MKTLHKVILVLYRRELNEEHAWIDVIFSSQKEFSGW